MILSDFRATLRNDISIDDESVYQQHSQMMEEKAYSAGSALLHQNPQIHGVTSGLFNQWEEKILSLEDILAQKPYYDPYLCNDSEPEYGQMENKAVWQQAY